MEERIKVKTKNSDTGETTDFVTSPKKFSFQKFKKNYFGLVYVLPTLIGIFIFTLIPMVVSLNYSFHEIDPTNQQNPIGKFTWDNYIRIFSKSWQHRGDWISVSNSLFITFRYAIVTVAVSMVGSYALALFLNKELKGIGGFRVVYYLPCLIPAVAGTLLWANITDTNTGYINLILSKLNLPKYTFYEKAETVFPTILIMGVFGWGGNMVMWLAQMKNIPREYYEAADIDGANKFRQLIHVTIPLTTSMVFYILITSIINALQVFGAYYPLITGANRSELNFIVIKIYDTAYVEHDWAYACALSWLLFVIIGALTALIFKTSKWVYYGDEN